MKFFNALTKNKSFGLQFFLMGRFAGMLLVSVLLAKSYLWLEKPISTYNIGQYELFLFVAGFINFFWVNALVRGMLGRIDTTNKENCNSQIVQVFYVFGGLSLIFGLIFLVFEYFFHFLGTSGILIIACASIYSLLWTPSMLLEYMYVLRKETLPMYLSGIATPICFVAFGFVGGFLTQSVDGVIFGTVIFSFFRFVAAALLILNKGLYKPDFYWIKKYLFFSLPLLLSAVIAESGVYIDGIIVNALFDEQTFAIFRYGARELPLNSIMALGLSNAMIPLFAATENPDIELSELKRKTNRLLLILIPISVVFLVFSDWLFVHVFNQEFQQSAVVFDVYLLLVLPRLLLPHTIIVGFKRNNLLIWVSIMEINTNVVLSIWWGMLWGIFGIAMATVFAFAVEKCVMIYLTKKRLHVAASKYIPFKTFTILSVILISVFIIKYTIFVSH